MNKAQQRLLQYTDQIVLRDRHAKEEGERWGHVDLIDEPMVRLYTT
jgi:hypothetical protein